MYLCYIDESGTTSLEDKVQIYFILAGMIVDEDGWKNFNCQIKAVVDKYRNILRNEVLSSVKTDDECKKRWAKLIPRNEKNPDLIEHINRFFRESFEFHSKDFFTGKHWCRGTQIETRHAMIAEIIDVIINNKPEIIYVVINKERHKNQYAYPDPVDSFAFMCLAEIFNNFLINNDKNGLLIADEKQGKLEQDGFKRNLQSYQDKGTDYKNKILERIIDSVHFTDSRLSYCIQAVDLITYLIRSNTMFKGENRLSPFYDKIKPFVFSKKHFP